jgi:hypothetical protein
MPLPIDGTTDAKKALGNGKFGSDFAFTGQAKAPTLVKWQALPCFPPSRLRVFAVQLRYLGSRACGSRTAIDAGPNATWPAMPSTKGAKTRRREESAGTRQVRERFCLHLPGGGCRLATLVKWQALPCFPPSRLRVFAVQLPRPGSRACGSRTAIGAGPNSTMPVRPGAKEALALWFDSPA